MLSRIAGFVRDILTAAFLGAGPIADAFFVALKLPNFFRRVTAEGAFSFAFIPLYTETLEKEGKEKADLFSAQSLSALLYILIPFTVLAIIFMPQVIELIAPGFEVGEERYNLAIELAIITFPYLACMSVVAMIGGILNAHDRFMPFAATPIFFNLTLIAALLGLSGILPNAGYALAYGVLGAGFIQLLWIFFHYSRNGHKLRLSFNVFQEKVGRLFKLMAPAALGAGVTQVNLFVDIILASFLPMGAVSYLYYADRLNQLPLGVVGLAIGTALLPLLSRAVAAQDRTRSSELFSQSLKAGALFAFPSAFGFIILAEPMIAVLFERGSFDAQDRSMTALALQAYSIGLPAYIGIKIYNTVCFSRQNTKAPLYISAFVTILNILLSLCLIYGANLGHVGIALATGLTGWMHLLLLHIYVVKKKHISFQKQELISLFKIIASAFVMLVGLYCALPYIMDYLFAPSILLQIFALTGLIFGGAFVYSGCLLISRAYRLNELKRMIRKEKP